MATRAATPKPQMAEDAEKEVGSQYYSGYRSGHYVQTPVIQTAAFQIISATESNPALYALSAKTTQLTMATTAIPLSSNFGASDTSTVYVAGAFVPQTLYTTAYAGSQLLSVASLPLTAAQLSSDYPYPLTTGSDSPAAGRDHHAHRSGKRFRPMRRSASVAASGCALHQRLR